MSFSPRPSPARVPREREQRGRVVGASATRVRASIAAAPVQQRVDVDALQRRGQEPHRGVTEVRPPTQSHIGNASSKPCVRA